MNANDNMHPPFCSTCNEWVTGDGMVTINTYHDNTFIGVHCTTCHSGVKFVAEGGNKSSEHYAHVMNVAVQNLQRTAEEYQIDVEEWGFIPDCECSTLAKRPNWCKCQSGDYAIMNSKINMQQATRVVVWLAMRGVA